MTEIYADSGRPMHSNYTELDDIRQIVNSEMTMERNRSTQQSYQGGKLKNMNKKSLYASQVYNLGLSSSKSGLGS